MQSCIIYREKQQLKNVGYDVAMLMKKLLISRNDTVREHFCSIGLNSDFSILYVDQLLTGPLNKATVYPLSPRRVFQTAMFKGASLVILYQNRLSEDPTPLEEDICLTHRLSHGGRILGIDIFDHIISCTARYLSFREYGITEPFYRSRHSMNLKPRL